ncbi:MAG: hypothetical protein J0I09_09750 [Sphingobacteriia bacterium]|nr:hypothetical protein [Sphingobacteriia bacterium]
MKKLIMAAIIAIAVTTSAFAAHETVSYRILSQFRTDFSDATNVSWKVGKDFVKATFVLEDEKIEAFYNNAGELVATSKAIDFNKLPKKALRVIGEKYPFPPYELKEAIEMTTADSGKEYYVSFTTQKESIVLKVDMYGTVSEFKRSEKQ